MSKKLMVGTFLSIGILTAVFVTDASAFWPFEGWKSKGEVKAATTDQNSRSSLFDRLRSKRMAPTEPSWVSTDSAVMLNVFAEECTVAEDGSCTTSIKRIEDKINADSKGKLVLSSPTNSKLDSMAKMCARSEADSKLNNVYSKWFTKKMAALGFSSKSKYNPETEYKSFESEFEAICARITALDKKVDAFESNYKNWMTYSNTSTGKMPVPTGVTRSNCTYQAVKCIKEPCPEIAICVTPSAPTPKREPYTYQTN